MKKVLGCIRRACEDFHLIEDGDIVAVGVSGGKDSLLLLYALSLYRKFAPQRFELKGLTLTMGLEPFDTSKVAALCEKLGVEYIVRPTEIGRIIFEERHEKNPCSLCAKMRRGALNDLAKELRLQQSRAGTPPGRRAGNAAAVSAARGAHPHLSSQVLSFQSRFCILGSAVNSCICSRTGS